MDCRSFGALLLQEVPEGAQSVYVRLPCKSWSCPSCARFKSKKVGQKAEKIMAGEDARFFTLTMPHKGNLADSFKAIKAAWNRLRLAFVRKYGKIKYLWVLEAHKDGGWPHIHGFINKFVPVKVLSAMAAHAGFGPIVDIRKVNNEGAFHYILKYLSKGLGHPKAERVVKALRARRWGSSRVTAEQDEEEHNSVAVAFLSTLPEEHRVVELLSNELARHGINGDEVIEAKGAVALLAIGKRFKPGMIATIKRAREEQKRLKQLMKRNRVEPLEEDLELWKKVGSQKQELPWMSDLYFGDDEVLTESEFIVRW